MDRALETRLRNAGALTSLPGVAVRVVALARDPEVEADELIRTIQHDPAMTARVLRAANSVLYNHSRRITNLKQALVIMGTKGITNVALGFSFRGLIRGGNTCPTYWQRSVYAALVGREIAHRIALSIVEDVFVAALLQDIGILALEQALPEEYAQAVAGCGGEHDTRVAAERRALNTDHAEVGAWLLAQWALPDALVEAVRRSHDPRGAAPNQRMVVRCVAASGVIADIWLEADRELATERAWQACGEWLGMDAEALTRVLEAVDRRLPAMMDLFDLERAAPEHLDAALSEARDLLAARTAADEALAAGRRRDD